MLRAGSTIHRWRFEKYGGEFRCWVQHPDEPGSWREMPAAAVAEAVSFLVERLPEGRSVWEQVSLNLGEDQPLEHVDTTDVHAEFRLVSREWRD